MNDDDQILSFLTNGGPGYLEMDEAFCARMRMAIEVGLENAPIGVVTTPGTKNPKFVPIDHWAALTQINARVAIRLLELCARSLARTRVSMLLPKVTKATTARRFLVASFLSGDAAVPSSLPATMVRPKGRSGWQKSEIASFDNGPLSRLHSLLRLTHRNFPLLSGVLFSVPPNSVGDFEVVMNYATKGRCVVVIWYLLRRGFADWANEWH
jgi:hypothetical protein